MKRYLCLVLCFITLLLISCSANKYDSDNLSTSAKSSASRMYDEDSAAFYYYCLGYEAALEEAKENFVVVSSAGSLSPDAAATKAYAVGFDAGIEYGESSGYGSGYEDGFASGAEEGYGDGYEEGYRHGYEDGSAGNPYSE